MNPLSPDSIRSLTVRPAAPSDARAITRLLETASRSHFHPDWRPVTDWIGRAPAFVAEGPSGLAGCLLTSIDPPPVAWVRAAAVAGGLPAPILMHRLLSPCLRALAGRGLETLSAMTVEPWLAPVLSGLDFALVEQVETWHKPDLLAPRAGAPDVTIRPARLAEMAELASIDHLAFHPRWQFSAATLTLAWEKAAIFTVAHRPGRLVGFQISLSDDLGAHLARLTVHPAVQRSGVGSRLLADTLLRYASLGAAAVSLNTQVNNIPSHRLYAAFGFQPASPPVPVWERSVGIPEGD